MRRPTSALLRPPPQRLPLLMLLLLIAGRASASVRSIGSSSNIDYEAAAAAAAAADDWLIGESRSRRQPVAENPLDAMSWLNLRRFVCGGDANTRCLTDERFNQLQPDFVRKISARINGLVAATGGDVERPRDVQPLMPAVAAAVTAFEADPPSRTANALLPVSHEYRNDVNIWNSLNLSGRREGPFYVDEPDFVLTKEEMAVPSLLFDYINDPFIPQRGRRRTSTTDPNSARKRSAGPPLFSREAIDALLTTHQHRRQQQQLHRMLPPQRRRNHQQAAMTPLQLLSLLGDTDSGDGDNNGYAENNIDDDRVADRALGNVAARFFPRNLSPTATGPTTTATSTTTASKPAATNRDTFYLARGSCIHQQRQSRQQQQPQPQQRSPPLPSQQPSQQ